MVAHLEGAHALVGHVAVRARHAGARMDALVPHFELGVLGLEHPGPRLRVHPIREARCVVVRLDLLDFEAIGPRIRDDLAVSLEVVLHMTLTADERPHLLPVASRFGS